MRKKLSELPETKADIPMPDVKSNVQKPPQTPGEPVKPQELVVTVKMEGMSEAITKVDRLGGKLKDTEALLDRCLSKIRDMAIELEGL